MQLKPHPTASVAHISNMAMFRAHAKRNYTENPSVSVKFQTQLALLKGRLREYWSRDDAEEFIEYLTLRSWSYVDPPGYIEDFVDLALEGIRQNGDTLEGFKAAGLYDAPDSAEPVHNENRNIAKEKFSNKLNRVLKTPKQPPLGSN